MHDAIVVERLTKTFKTGSPLPFLGPPRREVHALVDVSLTIHAGEVFGLVGRNGYGKTTLIKCITSLVHPTSGRAVVLGHDSIIDSRRLRRQIGLVSADERSFYWRLTGYQNLLFFGRLQGLGVEECRRRIDAVGGLFELESLLSRPFHEYSTGNRQRLAILRALLHGPQLLVLDEPTRSLDPFAAGSLRRHLLEWVREQPQRTVLITTHNLNEVEELSDRVGIMSRGRLSELGTLAELREKHGSHESIEIDVDGEPASTVVEALRRHASDARVFPAPERGFALAFRRQKNDRVLDAVLRELVGAGIAITSFRRSELSLQDIVDRVDVGGPNDA